MPESTNEQELQKLDEADVSKLHWKIVLISGMGFFTDAYDLFIIGVVMAMLKPEWHLTAIQTGLVTSTALLASAVGAVLFGRVADLLGRKRIYGVEVLVLAAGAIACGLAPNIVWLIVFRIVLGLGIGGDYPVSATLMSEYAGKKSRGMLISLVFAMQAAGLIFGPLFAAVLLASSLSHDLIWRILLAFGAVPALAVFFARRKIDETPRFKMAQDKRRKTRKKGLAPRAISGADSNPSRAGAVPLYACWESVSLGFCLTSPITATPSAAPWFLLRSRLTPHYSRSPSPSSPSSWPRLPPCYLVAAVTMDRLGRKFIQVLGFGVMAAAFAAIALIPGIEKQMLPFLGIYGLSYFFTEFGPNTTTFVYPAEIFPVAMRTTGHGIAAAMGKVGAFIGVFLFPLLMTWKGLPGAEMAAALVSALGLVVTVLMLPETKGKTLEELNEGGPSSAHSEGPMEEFLAAGAKAES